MAMIISQMPFSIRSTSKSKNLQTACGMLGGAMQKQQLQSALAGVGSKRSAASAGAAECFQDASRYREEVITKICALKDVKPVKIDFNIFLTETTHSVWKTVLEDKSLYMTVPPVLSNGSKESFITLLEFAEERLGCARCVLCIPKYRSDRAALLRTFMFMGFQLLGPGAPELACPEGADQQDYLYMVYVME